MATKEDFLIWAKEQNWFFVNEKPNSTGGYLGAFMTPSGNPVMAIYDLKGNLEGFAMLVPQIAPQIPGLKLGGSGFPGLK